MKATAVSKRPTGPSSSAFLWINLTILILLCHLSSEVVNARGVLARRVGQDDEAGRAKAMLEIPGADNSPGHGQPQHVRVTRAAVFHRKNDARGVKHVQRIPMSGAVKQAVRADPEETYEESFESLEANREAFLDVLNDNAKHPHRKRPNKRHSKMILKFDDKIQRWSLTEQQSEEWFV